MKIRAAVIILTLSLFAVYEALAEKKCPATHVLVNGFCALKCKEGFIRRSNGFSCYDKEMKCPAHLTLVNGYCRPKCKAGEIRRKNGYSCYSKDMKCPNENTEVVDGYCRTKCQKGTKRNDRFYCAVELDERGWRKECPDGREPWKTYCMRPCEKGTKRSEARSYCQAELDDKGWRIACPGDRVPWRRYCRPACQEGQTMKVTTGQCYDPEVAKKSCTPRGETFELVDGFCYPKCRAGLTRADFPKSFRCMGTPVPKPVPK